MKAITQIPFTRPYDGPIHVNLFAKFIAWCGAQEKNRLGWLALSLAAHGCIITPLVALTVTISGNNFVFWVGSMFAMGMTLVINLAAQPTKITIPTFFISILIDIAIVVTCICQALA